MSARPRLPRATRAALALTTALLAACGAIVPGAEEPDAGVETPAPAPALTWELTWAQEGVERMPDGGWRVALPDGARVELRAGGLRSFRAELIACEHSHPEAAAGVPRAWAALLVPASAFAGHGETPGDSRSRRAVVEDLAELASQPLDRVTVAEPAYCGGHYLVAASPTTLWMEGRWTPAGGDEPRDVSAAIGEADGAILPLLPGDAATAAAALGLQDGEGIGYAPLEDGMRVRVVRDLQAWLSVVDFAALLAAGDDEALGRALLWALMDATRMEVTGAAPVSASASAEPQG